MTGIDYSITFLSLVYLLESMFLRTRSAKLISQSVTRLEIKKLYSHSHEWIAYDTVTRVATIGISKHAQEELGTTVYADLPEKGTKLQVDAACGNVESVKATSEILSPVEGVVTEVNEKVQNNPSLLNDSPEDEGWILKVQDATFDEKNLLDPEKYAKFVESGEK